MNEEFPVSASHKLALITSLPFVHTARRYYRLDVSVRSWTGHRGCRKIAAAGWEDVQTGSFRGSKSRNKVSVGEPAEGSLPKRESLSARVACCTVLWRFLRLAARDSSRRSASVVLKSRHPLKARMSLLIGA